jgi:hypothetical protein
MSISKACVRQRDFAPELEPILVLPIFSAGLDLVDGGVYVESGDAEGGVDGGGVVTLAWDEVRKETDVGD